MLESENGVEYVLLGFLSQDFWEGRCGLFRQLGGGNYYCRLIKFLQAEKTIRLKNLVKAGLTMKCIKNMYENANGKNNHLIKAREIELTNMLNHSRFEKSTCDVPPITYYIAGYIGTQQVKATRWSGCKAIFCQDLQPLSINIERITEMLNAFMDGNFISRIY